MKKDQKYYELKSAIEKTCIDAINKQKKENLQLDMVLMIILKVE